MSRLFYLFAFWIVMQGQLPADQLFPYLLAGKWEYLGGYDDPKRTAGETTQFVVSFTERRGLVGWGRDDSQQYHYVDDDLKQRMGVGFPIDSPRPMLVFSDSKPIVVTMSEPNSKPVLTLEERLNELEFASFSDMRWALFFGSSYHGIPATHLLTSLDSPDRVTESHHACGCLTITRDSGGRLENLRFVQKSDDLLTVRMPDKPLRTCRSNELNENFAEVEYDCTFETPLQFPLENQPWSATCSVKYHGQSGKIVYPKYRVTVSICSSNATTINEHMDRLLRSIPEGAEVLTHSNVEYVWSDGRPVKRTDKEGLRVAESLQFQGNRKSSFLAPVIALSLIFLGLLYRQFRLPRS